MFQGMVGMGVLVLCLSNNKQFKGVEGSAPTNLGRPLLTLPPFLGNVQVQDDVKGLFQSTDGPGLPNDPDRISQKLGKVPN